MSRQRFSADGEPDGPARHRGDGVQDWLSLTLPLMAIVGTLAGFWLLWQAMRTPVPVSVSTSALSSVSASSSPAPAATFPAELLQAAVALSTFMAPTPAPTPTPPITPAPAPPPALICGAGVSVGTICTMPTLAPPSPTPYPICPTMPGFDCIWLGSMAGTPVAIGGAGRGS